MVTEEEKQKHSQELAAYYLKELRPGALTLHRGKWIVMRTQSEYNFFTDEEMDTVFGKDWHYWDKYGCLCDKVGDEDKPILLG